MHSILLFCCLAVCATISSATRNCPFDYKVYVYPLPDSLRSVSLAVEARRNHTFNVCAGCIFEQFSLEFILFDFFTQFCGRTYNPWEADFFYLPIIRDVEYRVDKDVFGKRPSVTEDALLRTIEKNDTSLWKEIFNVTDYFWHRNRGADHIIVMPAPVTNLRHESGARGFFHYMIQLHRPIFINIEFSRSFVQEYPICATQKNIMAPYPMIDPAVLRAIAVPHTEERSHLLYYTGGNHGECVAVRMILKHIVNHVVGHHMQRGHAYRSSIFCPIPVGDSPTSKRMYDALLMGCIPVVLSDDMVWAFSTESGGSLDPSSFAITLPQKIVQVELSELLNEITPETLPDILPGSNRSVLQLLRETRSLSTELLPNTSHPNPLVLVLKQITPLEIAALQEGVARAADAYLYYRRNASQVDIPVAVSQFPDGEALMHISSKLSEIKHRGIVVLSDRCQRERMQPKHKYVRGPPCYKPQNKKGSLRRRRLVHDRNIFRTWI